MRGSRSLALALAAVVTLLGTVPASASAADGQNRGRARGLVPTVRGLAPARDLPSGYREPAFERGYGDGYERGLADGKRGARYDPVESRDYRLGDRGYAIAYGSRDAYRTNYRTGFRKGYEDGYRVSTR
jgi:hypothetical protein